jgi:hypothetical protein
MTAELPPPAPQTENPPEPATPGERGADWTLIQVSGRLRSKVFEGRPMEYWDGTWVALNQRGEVYLYGEWGDCWRSAQHWVRYQPPNGAAYGESGLGWRGTIPGLEEPA